MDTLSELRGNLTSESMAYGYTLSIWGSGAFLITAFGTLTPTLILAYIAGGVIGFGALAIGVFHRFFTQVESRSHDAFIVASMIHVLASLGNVFLSYLFIGWLEPVMPAVAVFFLIGFHATVTYNIMLLVEKFIGEDIYRLETRLSS